MKKCVYSQQKIYIFINTKIRIFHKKISIESYIKYYEMSMLQLTLDINIFTTLYTLNFKIKV